jgi:hypothetical protein
MIKQYEIDASSFFKEENMLALDLSAPPSNISRFYFGKTVDREEVFQEILSHWQRKVEIINTGGTGKRFKTPLTIIHGSPGTLNFNDLN